MNMCENTTLKDRQNSQRKKRKDKSVIIHDPRGQGVRVQKGTYDKVSNIIIFIYLHFVSFR